MSLIPSNRSNVAPVGSMLPATLVAPGNVARTTGGETGPSSGTVANSQLGGVWHSVASGSSYSALFGNQSYVKNNSDPHLLETLQQLLQKAPELASTQAGQDIRNGKVTPDDIKAVQSFLTSKGYSVGSTGVDGEYGPNTHAGLENFLQGNPPNTSPSTSSPATSGPSAGQSSPQGQPPNPLAASTGTGQIGGTGPVAPMTSPRPTGSTGNLIGPGTRVLQIGDSHTAGDFGKEMDKQLRASGATVQTVGASGSAPGAWLSGGTTQSGLVNRETNGQVVAPAWNSTQPIPKLSSLLSQDKPDVVLINLGANMRNGGAQQFQQVAALAQQAQQSGARVVWVGPPMQASDTDPSSMNAFNARMQAAVGSSGTYIPSSQFTSPSEVNPSDPMHIHYAGANAQNWADHVFNTVQGLPAN